MAGGAETPNIAALPAIARLGTCESARGPDADRHVKLLSQFAVEGSLSGAYAHSLPSMVALGAADTANVVCPAASHVDQLGRSFIRNRARLKRTSAQQV